MQFLQQWVYGRYKGILEKGNCGTEWPLLTVYTTAFVGKQEFVFVQLL